MKRNVLALVCVIAVSTILTGCTTAGSHAAWDYKIIAGDNGPIAPLEQKLNQASVEGWEVVTAAASSYPLVILRRPK